MLVKTKLFMALIEDGKAHFLQDCQDACMDHCNVVLRWGEKSGSPSNMRGQMKVYNQGAGWGSEEGKALRGNIGAKGDSG